jgi:hypothetical protein
MIEPHSHDADGHVIISEPSLVEVEADVAESAVRADVEVARIDADKEITLAKIAAKTVEATEESRVSQLEAELRGMKEMLARLMPADGPDSDAETVSEPEPVVVVPDDNDGPDELTPPESENKSESRAKPRSVFGMWQ